MKLSEKRVCEGCGRTIALFDKSGNHVASEQHFVEKKEITLERFAGTSGLPSARCRNVFLCRKAKP